VELITHSDLDPIFSFGKGEVVLTALELPPHLEGHRVRELTIPGEISIITITRGGEAILAAPALEFKSGDLVHLAVLASSVGRLESLLGI
jgi:trk system potassium uptake protein TrkA